MIVLTNHRYSLIKKKIMIGHGKKKKKKITIYGKYYYNEITMIMEIVSLERSPGERLWEDLTAF